MLSIRRSATAGAFAAAVLLLAACGSTAKTAGTTATTKASAPGTIGTRSTSAGTVVVDAAGKTLYKFDKDTAGSGSSACSGACATTWPPETVTGTPTAGAGVAGTIGVITRTDGTQQVTLDGHPLYHFSGDQAAGDTNGNGFGGIWHVVTSTGSASTGGSTATTRSGGIGY